METGSEKMLAEKEGAIGWMVFNNPDRRNAMSLDMFEAVPRIIEAFENDDEVKVIVLRGAGEKAFISGADISQFEDMRANAEQAAEYDKVSAQATERLQYTHKPTVAMIHGYCIGGGVGVAVSCDLRIASESARFGVPAARLGLGYQPRNVKKLLDLVGPAFTREIFYTARQFSSQEAFDMGLVNRMVADHQLEAYVREYAGTMADNAPLTLRSVKVAVQELLKDPEERDIEKAEALVRACFSSEDYVEGRRAFMEKRRPAFQGR